MAAEGRAGATPQDPEPWTEVMHWTNCPHLSLGQTLSLMEPGSPSGDGQPALLSPEQLMMLLSPWFPSPLVPALEAFWWREDPDPGDLRTTAALHRKRGLGGGPAVAGAHDIKQSASGKLWVKPAGPGIGSDVGVGQLGKEAATHAGAPPV